MVCVVPSLLYFIVCFYISKNHTILGLEQLLEIFCGSAQITLCLGSGDKDAGPGFAGN